MTGPADVPHEHREVELLDLDWWRIARGLVEPDSFLLANNGTGNLEPVGKLVAFFREGYLRHLKKLSEADDSVQLLQLIPKWTSFKSRRDEELGCPLIPGSRRRGGSSSTVLGFMEVCRIVGASYHRRVPVCASAAEAEALRKPADKNNLWSATPQPASRKGLFVRLTLQRCLVETSSLDSSISESVNPVPEHTTIDYHLDSGSAEFIIERKRYSKALSQGWKAGDRFKMFWAADDDPSVGDFFNGTVLGLKAVDMNDPSSATCWESIRVKWDEEDERDPEDETDYEMYRFVSPWEILPLDAMRGRGRPPQRPRAPVISLSDDESFHSEVSSVSSDEEVELDGEEEEVEEEQEEDDDDSDFDGGHLNRSRPSGTGRPRGRPRKRPRSDELPGAAAQWVATAAAAVAGAGEAAGPALAGWPPLPAHAQVLPAGLMNANLGGAVSVALDAGLSAGMGASAHGPTQQYGQAGLAAQHCRPAGPAAQKHRQAGSAAQQNGHAAAGTRPVALPHAAVGPAVGSHLSAKQSSVGQSSQDVGGVLETMQPHKQSIKMDWNSFFCSECHDGGHLVACDGPCLRSFHMDCLPAWAQPASGDKSHWYCPLCRVGLAQCTVCGLLGKAGDAVVKCCLASCGRYYHPSCLVKLMPNLFFKLWDTRTRDLTLQQLKRFVEDRRGERPLFRCPAHFCQRCHLSGDSLKMLPCWLCPRAYHAHCLPKGSCTTGTSKHVDCPWCSNLYSAEKERQEREFEATAGAQLSQLGRKPGFRPDFRKLETVLRASLLKPTPWEIGGSQGGVERPAPASLQAVRLIPIGRKLDAKVLLGKSHWHLGTHARGGGCDFQVNVQGVKLHTRIVVSPDGLVTAQAIHTATRTTPLLVNGREASKEEEVTLNHGDVLEIGPEKFRVDRFPLSETSIPVERMFSPLYGAPQYVWDYVQKMLDVAGPGPSAGPFAPRSLPSWTQLPPPASSTATLSSTPLPAPLPARTLPIIPPTATVLSPPAALNHTGTGPSISAGLPAVVPSETTSGSRTASAPGAGPLSHGKGAVVTSSLLGMCAAALLRQPSGGVPAEPAAVSGPPAAVPGQPAAMPGQPAAVLGQPPAVPGSNAPLAPPYTGIPARPKAQASQALPAVSPNASTASASTAHPTTSISLAHSHTAGMPLPTMVVPRPGAVPTPSLATAPLVSLPAYNPHPLPDPTLPSIITTASSATDPLSTSTPVPAHLSCKPSLVTGPITSPHVHYNHAPSIATNPPLPSLAAAMRATLSCSTSIPLLLGSSSLSPRHPDATQLSPALLAATLPPAIPACQPTATTKPAATPPAAVPAHHPTTAIQPAATLSAAVPTRKPTAAIHALPTVTMNSTLHASTVRRPLHPAPISATSSSSSPHTFPGRLWASVLPPGMIAPVPAPNSTRSTNHNPSCSVTGPLGTLPQASHLHDQASHPHPQPAHSHSQFSCPTHTAAAATNNCAPKAATALAATTATATAALAAATSQPLPIVEPNPATATSTAAPTAAARSNPQAPVQHDTLKASPRLQHWLSMHGKPPPTPAPPTSSLPFASSIIPPPVTARPPAPATNSTLAPIQTQARPQSQAQSRARNRAKSGRRAQSESESDSGSEIDSESGGSEPSGRRGRLHSCSGSGAGAGGAWENTTAPTQRRSSARVSSKAGRVGITLDDFQFDSDDDF